MSRDELHWIIARTAYSTEQLKHIRNLASAGFFIACVLDRSSCIRLLSWLASRYNGRIRLSRKLTFMRSFIESHPGLVLPRFAHCFGCGHANPHGHQLKCHLVGEKVIARFTPAAMYSGGYPGNVYGGMIASLLDCHGTASAAAFAYQSLGHDMEDGLAGIRFVTASLKIDFRQPTPIGVELTIIASLRALHDRKAEIAMTLGTDGNVSVSAEMLAVRLRAKHG